MALTVVARITAVAGEEEALRQALEALVAPTRAEAGCLQYDLHRDNDAPGVFLFFEIWESRALWQDHMAAPHILAHQAATGEMVADVALHEMTLIA